MNLPSHYASRRFLFAFVVAVWGINETAWGQKQHLPPLSEIKGGVLRYFRAQTDYRPGDFVTRQQLQPLVTVLVSQGVPKGWAHQIMQRSVDKDEFLAKQFGTPAGRQFMREIARYPKAFDRLDRLARLPHGQQTIQDLIRGPDGEKLVQYMTMTSGGKELGRMLSYDPNNKDFNAPTGRIYTAEGLLEWLEKAWTREKTPPR